VALGILSFLAGCDPDVSSPGISPQPQDTLPIPTFNLVGTIRAADNTPLSGAIVTLTNFLQQRRETQTDTAGRYEIRGISGTWNVIVSVADHIEAVSVVVMNADRVLDFRLIPVSRPLPFEVGKEFAYEVDARARPCDPVHWDANAPCARLRFQAPRTGLLSVLLDWEGSNEVDFTIMSDDEASYLTYAGTSGHTASTSFGVIAGTYYVIWVHSYYGAASFTIRADINP
jgi:hypothetical protein